ncbi:hypothetical protein [uncultured Cohaesibacter sp.]|uniref:hypothetical protein n=1 Tax=uncultured Cohaesibacter sp. TaxID=1002546 RepID=UPI0029C8CD81|nr:hypothetical protein [uncultured Cohaesibacter sp.]
MQTYTEKNTGQSVDLPVVAKPRSHSGVKPLGADLPDSEERILETVQRGIRAVARETKALREKGKIDLRTHSDEKSRILLDLSRLTKGVDIEALSPSVTSELLVLRKMLTENEHVLKQHLEAVREITELLSKAMLEAESDGTYAAGMTE